MAPNPTRVRTRTQETTEYGIAFNHEGERRVDGPYPLTYARTAIDQMNTHHLTANAELVTREKTITITTWKAAK